MKNTKTGEVIRQLSQQDISVIKCIYDFRCLTKKQINALVYKTEEAELDKKIEHLLNLNVMEETIYANLPPVYFLTTLGINVVRQCYALPTAVFNRKTRKPMRGYLRASELKVSERFINHQLHLNQFVIDFMNIGYDTYWRYGDEKHLEKYLNIRPDGILTIFDVDFFIEIDMGTETKQQLFEKWDNYRSFINSIEFYYKERPIVVLFVIESTTRVQERIDLVKHTVFERIADCLNADFEVYVDTHQNILSIIQRKIIPKINGGTCIKNKKLRYILSQKFQFSIMSGGKLKDYFNGTEYNLYIRKTDEKGNIIIENNRFQEFLVVDYFDAPMSTLSKVSYFSFNNTAFRNKFARDIPLIVVGDSLLTLFKDFQLTELLVVDNVFFTTLERLSAMSFPEALVKFDTQGNIYHFLNSGLEAREFEQNLFKQ